MNLKLACFSDFIGHNFFGTGFFFGVDVLPSGDGGGGGGGGGGLRIEVASMRLKIEQRVAYG